MTTRHAEISQVFTDELARLGRHDFALEDCKRFREMVALVVDAIGNYLGSTTATECDTRPRRLSGYQHIGDGVHVSVGRTLAFTVRVALQDATGSVAAHAMVELRAKSKQAEYLVPEPTASALQVAEFRNRLDFIDIWLATDAVFAAFEAPAAETGTITCRKGLKPTDATAFFERVVAQLKSDAIVQAARVALPPEPH